MSQRSLLMQQAQAIRSAQVPAGPSTIVYNTTSTDNRSNYQEVTGGGTVESLSLQIADVIGQNTNAVGSMNTGSTTIEVGGSNNQISAINSSDSNGCIDASVQQLSSTLTDLGSAQGGIQPTISFPGRSMACN